jgi:hypothetical protein
VTALLVALSLAAAGGPPVPVAPPPLPAAPAGGWTGALDAARTAWRYFERNTDPATGLVSSVDGYPSATGWDQGSALIAAVAARELGLVAPDAFDAEVEALLKTLATQPLFEGAVPNKAYDTRTGRMTDYRNAPAPAGVGYSAVDLGRLASALVLLGELHARHRPGVERVLARWDLCRVIQGGELHGAQVDASGETRVVQEGRLGYEQYAAKAFALLGRDAARARRWDRWTTAVEILGVPVPRDRRDRRRYGAVDAVVTEPWVLDAFEFGHDPVAAPLARRVFEVQKRRWEATGAVTALSEDHVDRPPWFVYDGIWADGHAWRTVSADGAPVEGLRALSAKAALSLAALYPGDPYAAVLRSAAQPARDPGRGWYAGVYEGGEVNRTLTANTNGVILEAALFAERGPLHALAAARPGAEAWRASLAGVVPAQRRCLSAAAAAVAGAGSGTGSGGAPGADLPGPGAAGLEHPRPPPAPRHAIGTGTLFFDYRGDDRGGTGALATIYPYGSWFARGGGEWTPFSPFGKARFLWGFGYDDWHDNTFSATIHNWGPIRLSPEGPPASTDRPELNLGYKVPRLCVRPLCLAAFPSVTFPFDGGPWVSGRLTLTLFQRVFVMGGLGWTIPHVLPPPPGTPNGHVFWGVGLQDWRAWSFFLTYYDWGPDARQRTGSGVVALGMNWAF